MARLQPQPLPQVPLLEDLDARCPHPPRRLFAWHVGKTLCVACCACGEVLSGGAQ